MRTKKFKIFLLVTILLIALTACGDKKETDKDVNTEQNEKPNNEATKPEEDKLKEDKEAEEKKQKEEAEKKAAEEKAAEEKRKKEEEEKKAAEEKKRKEEEEKKAAEEKMEQERLDNLENIVLGFNNRETENLRNLAKKSGITVTDDNNGLSGNINPDDLEAISIFEKSNSYGWICKYGDDQIGVAEVELSEKDDGASSPIKLWTEYMLFDGAPSGIRNNNVEQFKLVSQQIAQDFFDETATVKHLY